MQKCSLRAPRQRKANRNGQPPFSDFFDLPEMVAAPGCVRLSCQDVGRKFAGDPGDPLARAPISRRFCPRSVLTGTSVRVGSIVHVDVGQDRDERTVAGIGDALKCQGRIGQTQVNRPERRSRRNCWRNSTSTRLIATNVATYNQRASSGRSF